MNRINTGGKRFGEPIVTISRRLFVATGGSLGLLTLAACSSDPVKQAETPETPAASVAGDNVSAVSADVELYNGYPVEPFSDDPLLNPDGIKDRPLGGKNAKVVIVEYSSPTCSHCATFVTDIYPAFKAKYIDTGKVTFILRPLVRNVLDAVVYLLADAAGPENYNNVVETYFKTMMTWIMSDTPRDEMEKIALQLGFNEESFESALTNQTLFDGLERLRNQAINEFNVTGTPTFFINGEKYAGEQSMAHFTAWIDPLLT